MTSRRASEKANTVSLFPFLAVLLCTMGSLLVLLVVLAQRATEQAEAAAKSTSEPAEQAAPPEPSRSRSVDLDQIRRQRERLQQKLAQIEDRIDDEKSRLGHLEEHNRRVEHQLAKLYVANEQLKAVENEQQVDQVQAEQELARLKDLIAAAQNDLETAREEYVEQPPKTLFVYRGPHGTTRPPVYIECSSLGVTLQPEGVTLAADDFQTPLRAGNALALAVRATQDYAARRQLDSGQSVETPYPLVVVRPGGRKQFNRVVRALTAADLQYGYEFLGADAELAYADADPALAEVQHHAVLQARSRQELLAMAAPSRFGGSRRYAGGGGGGLGGDGGYGGGGIDARGNHPTALGGAPGDGRSGSNVAGGPPDGSLSGDGQDSSSSDEDAVYGAAGSSAAATAIGGASGSTRWGEPGGQGPAGSGTDASGGDLTDADPHRYAQQSGGEGAGGRPGGDAATGGAPSGGSGGSGAGGGAPSSTAHRQATAGAAGVQTRANQPTLTAEATTRGANWAVGQPQVGVAMRRPIRVVVGADQLSVLPSRHRIDRTGQIRDVSLQQHPRRVLDQFSQAIRDHMQEWGLAGRGMHWRPVVVLEVAGDADQQARELARALERSGVDVQFPATASAPAGGPRGATR